MSKKLIYIADDEVHILDIMAAFLKREDFEVVTFRDGQSLVEAFQHREADLLILDIMMPEMDGYSVSSLIRKTSGVPIIIVSAKDTEADRIAGLTLGGDDYLTKPFSPLELVARVKSIFRRIDMDTNREEESSALWVADIALDPAAKRAKCRGQDLRLTGLEFALLQYMMEHQQRALSRKELLDKVWGFDAEVETRATDDAVKRLRKKLADAGSTLQIDTVWGFGFRVQEMK